jgi:tetratricopeptide (TPR) repeat protein
VKRIAAESFIESPAGVLFQKGDYQGALSATDELLVQYPEDPLLLRYKAIILSRLGRNDEAIAIFQKLLDQDPAHTPTHFFLAQAYENAGRGDEAQKEYRWVMDRGEASAYQQWSSEALERSGKKPAAANRWEVGARYGYEYDSNVTLKPDDRTVAAPGDQNAGRQTLDFTLGYRAYSDRDKAVDLYYATRQSFHDDSLNEFNFHSEEWGISFRKRLQMGQYDVIAGLRYDLMLGFLDDEMFSLRNIWTLSADTRLTPYTRTVAYSRSSADNFGQDGILPGQTSRDGYYQDLGVTQYFYSKDFARYAFVRPEVNGAMTRGDNFDSLGWNVRTGFRSLLSTKRPLNRFAVDFSTGLGFGYYPNFSSLSTADVARRRDVDWDIYTALTYQLTRDLGLRAYYRFIDSWNQNNFYDYTRHIGGTQLIYTKKF